MAREAIAVIGTGYVGLVTAVGFAELGNEVWCVDIDSEKVAALNRGDVPIYEPGLQERLSHHRDRLHFSTELGAALERARLLFVAVGTPPTYSGDADLSAVNQVVAAMPYSDRHALVMKSTVPVGTGEAIKRTFAAAGKASLAYVSCPEFLREGSALHDFLHPDRVVVGDDGDWAGDAVVALYSPLDAPLVRTTVASAEMIKLAANAFLATKISFINEIANVCEETGADVLEVARGMGLDDRIGHHFLKAGIGYGGSCFAGEETVLARHHGRTLLLSFERLWRRLAAETEELDEGLMAPEGLEVLSWMPGTERQQFLPVLCMTRRAFEGQLVEVRTTMGRRVRCTPDHGWIVSDGLGADPKLKLAEDLTASDWVPLTMGGGDNSRGFKTASLMLATEAAEISPEQLTVYPRREYVDDLVPSQMAGSRRVSYHAPSANPRGGQVTRTQMTRLGRSALAEIPPEKSTIRATENRDRLRSAIPIDEAFWRVVGLYIADGCASEANKWTLTWSFAPRQEQHLADEVVSWWLRQGVEAKATHGSAATVVSVSSRLIWGLWIQVLGLGRNWCEQRLSDLVWEQSDSDKWALLSGLFEGRGSWSLVNGGGSAVIELGKISDELADGVLRLLADVGIVASQRIARTRQSTKAIHWIQIAGADQVERAVDLIPKRDRPGVLASLARRHKRIAPTGYRRPGDCPAWVRVTSTERQPFTGSVYSLEVCYAHTVVTTGGTTASNCFPKDVSALKQLAGNSGYHFQLLTAVIEVNELQKRRVMAKLHKHLGSLVGREIALLGLAFKANTDDMREASSLVLSARLLADGARVRAYDPVAEKEARKLMAGVSFADSADEALTGADACVIVTDWPEFADLDWRDMSKLMEGKVVIDGRNVLDPYTVRRAGLVYEGIGR